MTAAAPGAEEQGSGLGRVLASFFWVLGATAACVAALGALPGWIAGDAGTVRRAATIQEAERRLGARILVPGYFPARLEWPPVEIRVAGGRRGSVLLVFGARGEGSPVTFLQATRDGAPIAPELLAGRTVLRSSPALVHAMPATLSDVLEEGHLATELAWELHGRAVMLRSAGDLEELFRMARSAHREGGR